MIWGAASASGFGSASEGVVFGGGGGGLSITLSTVGGGARADSPARPRRGIEPFDLFGSGAQPPPARSPAGQAVVRSRPRRFPRSIAIAMSFSTRARAGMPEASQSFGYIEIAVNPGSVLISFT